MYATANGGGTNAGFWIIIAMGVLVAVSYFLWQRYSKRR